MVVYRKPDSFRVQSALIEHLESQNRLPEESRNLVNQWVITPLFEYDVRRLAGQVRRLSFSNEQMIGLKGALTEKALDLVSDYDPQIHGQDGSHYLSEHLASFTRELIEKLPMSASVSMRPPRSKPAEVVKARISPDQLSLEQKGWVKNVTTFRNELALYFSGRSDPAGTYATIGDILHNATIHKGITSGQLNLLHHFSELFETSLRRGQLFESNREQLIQLQKNILKELDTREGLHQRVVHNSSLRYIVDQLPQVITHMEAGHNIHSETITSLAHILQRVSDTSWSQDLWDQWAQLQIAYEKARQQEFLMSADVQKELKRGEIADGLMRRIQQKRIEHGL